MTCERLKWLVGPQIVCVKYVPTLDLYFERAEDVLAFYVRYA
jgi:hypothetical protein